MSVQVNQYLAYGFYVPFKDARQCLIEKLGEDKYTEIADNYYDNAFKQDITEVNGCSLIEDGMNGKYTFFGKIFKKSKNYEHIQTCEIPKVTKKIKDNVNKEFISLFGGQFSDFSAKMMVITHYR